MRVLRHLPAPPASQGARASAGAVGDPVGGRDQGGVPLWQGDRAGAAHTEDHRRESAAARTSEALAKLRWPWTPG
ncbi:MAG: hypothetical protein ABIJ48_01685 [Actinomycetota bacterium]